MNNILDTPEVVLRAIAPELVIVGIQTSVGAEHWSGVLPGETYFDAVRYLSSIKEELIDRFPAHFIIFSAVSLWGEAMITFLEKTSVGRGQ